MQTLGLSAAFWFGANIQFVLLACGASLITWAVLFYPLRKRKTLLWNTVISIGFLYFSWKIFGKTAGYTFSLTDELVFSIVYGLLFASITASTPIILIKFITANWAKWLYSFVVIILVGSSTSLLHFGLDIDGSGARQANEIPSDDQSGQGTLAALMGGALEGDLDQVKDAVGRGAHVDEQFLGLTALYYASGKGHIHVVKYLLINGADINQQNGPSRRTALHEASLRGRYDVVKLLLEMGADVNARNTHNRTPLFYVTSPPPPLHLPANNVQIQELLIHEGGTL